MTTLGFDSECCLSEFADKEIIKKGWDQSPNDSQFVIS